jgi:hypothetical protein
MINCRPCQVAGLRKFRCDVILHNRQTEFLKHGKHLTMLEISERAAETAGKLRGIYTFLKTVDQDSSLPEQITLCLGPPPDALKRELSTCLRVMARR